jgi:hypothetical protein
MKKVFTYLTLIALTVTFLADTSIVNAKVNSIQNVATSKSASCKLTADIDANCVVILPKTITIDSSTKSATYTVKISGDINEKVKVVPDKSVNLKHSSKNPVKALISQDKKSWNYDEVSVIGNGKIDAKGLSAGKWSGTLNFKISLI